VPTSPSPQHSLSPAACPLTHSSLSPDGDITHAPQPRQRDRAGASIEGKHPKPLARSAKTSPSCAFLRAQAWSRVSQPQARAHESVPTTQPVPSSLSPYADITHAPQQRQRDRAGASIEGKHPKPLARSAKTSPPCAFLRAQAWSRVSQPQARAHESVPTTQPVPSSLSSPPAAPQPVPSSLSPEASLGRNWPPQTSPPIRTDRISLESEGLWRDPEPCLSPADYNCGPLPG
jgi:hypothetical protein